MNPKKKAEKIERLARAIGHIATDFERFGGQFLEVLLEIPMNHQGVNLLGYPVAGVVDSVSDDGRVVAEYSAASSYFDGNMAKAREDLRKALRRKPNAKHVFLLSAQPKRPAIAQAFETRAHTWKSMTGKDLHLWGAEEIAARLLEDLIVSDTAVRRLSEFLPELQRIRNEEEVGRLAPAPDSDYLARPYMDDELRRRLAEERCVAISGLGGLGKSVAAAAFAADQANKYDLVIWVDGPEVERAEDLQALTLGRGGETRNVSTLLQMRACLLIIDDANDALDHAVLARLCGPNSHVLLTRRRRSPGSYDVPHLTREEATAILNRDAPLNCPTNVLDEIWNAVGGHPLTLGLMNAAVAEGALWQDIAADCSDVGRLEDNGQLLADRLLARLRATMQNELSVFAWAGQSFCSDYLLEETILPLGLRKLRAHSLTTPDRPGVTRLHDVVFAALPAGDWCSVMRATELTQALEDHLIAAAAETGLRHWTTASILRMKLEGLVANGDRRPAFLYALLSVWDPEEIKPEMVGDPVSEAAALRGLVPPPLAVITVIEAIEKLFLREKLAGAERAAEGLRARLDAFDELAALPGLTDREQAEIQHHKAKALKRLGLREAAAQLFEAVLDGPFPLNESRLQLIDLYRNDKVKIDRAESLVDEILSQTAGQNDVTYSVFLGAVERLPWGSGKWRSAMIRQHADAIERTILAAAKAGVPQAIRAFSAIGRYLSKEEPAFFRKIFQQLPPPALEALKTDSERFSWGEVYFEASRLPTAEAGDHSQLALEFYESEARPEPFHRQRQAELLIEMGRPTDAENLLREWREGEMSEWIQRLMARARFAQGDAKGALEWIDRALGRLKAEQFRCEFLELRYEIRLVLNDVDAIEDLKKAYGASQKDAERIRIRSRLQALGIT